MPSQSTFASSDELLCYGLRLVGFNESRQRVTKQKNILRFKSWYGVEPTTLLPIYNDVRKNHPDIDGKCFLMGMNWLTVYHVYPVMAGIWGYGEEFIGKKVKEVVSMIQELKGLKIRFEFKDEKAVFIASYDTVNFIVEEFRYAKLSCLVVISDETKLVSRFSDLHHHLNGLTSRVILVAW